MPSVCNYKPALLFLLSQFCKSNNDECSGGHPVIIELSGCGDAVIRVGTKRTEVFGGPRYIFLALCVFGRFKSPKSTGEG